MIAAGQGNIIEPNVAGVKGVRGMTDLARDKEIAIGAKSRESLYGKRKMG